MFKAKVIIPIIVVLVLAGIGVGLALRGRGGEAQPVQVAPAELRTVVQKVSANGKIQPQTQVEISADVSAKITRLEVKEGDWVEKGQLLFELDRERYLAAVDSAEANLRSAQSNVNLARENMVKAQKDLDRTEQLFAQKLESQANLDTMSAAAEVEKARHQSLVDQVEQSRAALKQARDDLSKTTVTSPLAGTVSKLNKEVGEICLGSQFQKDVVLIVSNLTGMEALVDVDENDIVLVSLEDQAEIEVDALPDRVLEGEVTEIASSAKTTGEGTSEQKTEFEVKVGVVDDVSALRPGMTASCEIVTETREGVVTVPIQSVTVRTPAELGVKAGPGEGEGDAGDEAPRFEPDREGFVRVVWVLDGDVVKARQVTTGIQGDEFIEITDGLAEGEKVVVGSYRAISRELKDGTQVRVESGPPARG
jgi:HlyD family secretion protein